MNEFEVIRRYFSSLTASRADTALGIGDDCAVLSMPSGYQLAVSTDTLVSGRHFFADTDPYRLGHKSLAVNLSDLAAMGAKPAWVSLALTLPEINHTWLQGFSSGFADLARQFDVQLIGGDMTRGPLSITVTVHGLIAEHQALQRSTARVGDLIVVSGRLGDAAGALKGLQAGTAVVPELQAALEKPLPRISLGQQITAFAHACIDISDGLLADLGHICQASGCGALLQLTDLPLSSHLKNIIDATGDWSLVLAGGDDYELCFTISKVDEPRLQSLSSALDLPLTVIGEITEDNSVVCLDAAGQPVSIAQQGFEHFQAD